MNPPITRRPDYKYGDPIVCDDGKEGIITAPPDEKHPHTARVALEDGGLYDIGLSRIRPKENA